MFTVGWFYDILFYGESGNPPLHVTASDQQRCQVLCHNLAKLKSGGEKPGISTDNGSRAEVSMGFNGIQWDSMGFNGIQWDSMGFNGIQWGAPMHAMSCDFKNFRYQILSFDHPMTIDDPWFEGSTALCLASWQGVQQRREFVWQCAPESNKRSSDNHHWKKQMLVGCIPYFQADPADTSILLGIWWPMISV